MLQKEDRVEIVERDFGYDFVRFFATLLIVVHHFYTTCRDYKVVLNENIKYFIAHGATSFGCGGVALFFILSGAVLWMTNKNISIPDFFKKRSQDLYNIFTSIIESKTYE